MMRGLLLTCLCLSTVALCTGTRVWVTDHGGNVLASESQQLTAMGLAAPLTTLAGSTGLTVDSAAAAEVRLGATGRARVSRSTTLELLSRT